jgi:hypothetical protein
MTDNEKYQIVRGIVERCDAAIRSAEAGECPAGMTEEQWDYAELADIIEGLASIAVSEIRSII